MYINCNVPCVDLAALQCYASLHKRLGILLDMRFTRVDNSLSPTGRPRGKFFDTDLAFLHEGGKNAATLNEYAGEKMLADWHVRTKSKAAEYPRLRV